MSEARNKVLAEGKVLISKEMTIRKIEELEAWKEALLGIPINCDRCK